MYKKNKLYSAILGVLSATLGTQVIAQTPASSVEEEVIVTGIRGSLQSAARIKESASGVVDAISAEELGKFPDSNVAESLQRITGVAITRSRGGEGQFVTVRGLGEEFNSVTFNGRPMATESGGREFSFDVIASELISEAQIYKTSQAALGDGSIGGYINVKTARPFDNPGFHAAGSAAGIYDELADDTGTKFSGIISNTFADDTIGVLLSFSHSKRDIRTDIVEGVNFFNTDIDTNGRAIVTDPDAQGNPVVQWRDDVTGAVVAPGTAGASAPVVGTAGATFSSLTTLFSLEERERTGGTLAFQFRPNDSVDITFDVLYSAFESPAESFGVSFFPDNPRNLGFLEANENNFIDSFEANVNVDLLSRAVNNDTETFQYGLNGIFNVNSNLTLTGDISYSTSEGTRNNTGPATNSGSFYVVQVPGGRASTESFPRQVQNFTFLGPAGNTPSSTTQFFGPGTTDPSNLVPLDQVDPSLLSTHFSRNDTNEIEDEIFFVKGDAEYVFDDDTRLSFGFDYTDREKTTLVFNNLASACPTGFCGSAATFASIDPNFQSGLLNVGDFLSDTSATLPRNFPIVSVAEIERLYTIREAELRATGGLAGVPEDILRPRLIPRNSNVIEEQIFGAFVQLDLSGEVAGIPWQGNAGVRLVRTNLASSGVVADVIQIVNNGQGNQDINTGPETNVTISNGYTNVLPSFNIAFNLTDNLILRNAFSTTISRPTISDLTTAVSVSSTNANTEAQVFGNPLLDPPESNNFDLSLEWYGENASASAAIFYKDLSNFVANINTFEPLNVEFIDNASGTPVNLGNRDVNFNNSRPTNGDTAEITGLELAYQMIFESGLGFLANVTFTDSDATVAGIESDFENLSDFSYNLSGFYEDGPWQVRVSLNHRDEYLETTSGLQGRSEFITDFTQIDASASFDINDNLTVFVEGLNLTGEDFLEFSDIPEAVLTFEDREPRYNFGIRGSF